MDTPTQGFFRQQTPGAAQGEGGVDAPAFNDAEFPTLGAGASRSSALALKQMAKMTTSIPLIDFDTALPTECNHATVLCGNVELPCTLRLLSTRCLRQHPAEVHAECARPRHGCVLSSHVELSCSQTLST